MATGNSRANDVNVKVGVDPTSLRAGILAAQQSIASSVGNIQGQFYRAQRGADAAGAAAERAGRRAGVSGTGWSVLKRQLLAFTTATVALHQTFRFAGAIDEMTMLSSRLEQVTGSAQNAAAAKERLYRIAQNLQGSYTDLSKSFTKMLPLVERMGGGVAEAERLSASLVATARLSGATTLEAAAAQLQFAQAIGSGKLQGDELRSILENNQVLATALTDALGVSIGEIRTLGRQNKLTSDVVANAILQQYDKIMERASKLEYTMGGAWEVVGNATIRAAESFDKATDFSRYIVVTFRTLATVLDDVSARFTALTGADKEASKAKIMAFAETALQVFARLADFMSVVLNQFRILAEVISSAAVAIGFALSDPLGRGLELAGITMKQGMDNIKGIATRTAEALERIYDRDGYKFDKVPGTKPDEHTPVGSGKPMKLPVDGRNVGAEIEMLREAEEARLQELDKARAHADLLFDIQKISKAQHLELQRQFEIDRFNIIQEFGAKRAALEVEKAKDGVEEDAEQKRKAVERFREHQKNLAKLSAEMAQEQYRHTNAFWDQMQNGMSQMLQAMFQGTLKFRDIWRTVLIGTLDIFTGVLSQMIAESVIGFIRQKTSIMISASSAISAYAAQAGAAAYAATAAIPIFGPGLAMPAGLAAYGEAMSFQGLIAASASGGYDIPFNRAPLTQLHPEEMVLPKPIASVIREAMSGGGVGAGGSGGMQVNVPISAMDGDSVERWFSHNSDRFTDMVKAAAKRAGLVPR